MPDDLLILDGAHLTCADVASVAAGRRVGLAPGSRAQMVAASSGEAARSGHEVLAAKWSWLMGTPQGEGAQRIFIEGHCSGVGEPLPVPQVRAMMLVRANVLATGHTGCRPEAADLLIDMLNRGVTPVVPTHGDVGAAGSVPLAHMVYVACRYGGEAWVEGERLPASDAMRDLVEFAPTELEALSLINGSSFATALGALAVVRAEYVLSAFDAAAALSMETVRADSSALNAEAIEARRHPYAARVAERLRGWLSGSTLVDRRRDPDSFSIRCTPVVHGASWEALAHVRSVIDRELNGASDNPLLVSTGWVETGAFHGAPVALVMDHLRASLTVVAGISERRTFRLTYGKLSGLPSFLVEGSGVDSGLMLAQYTAASLVSEAKGLSHPASVDNVPTVQHHEDHVSMASVASRAALEVVDILADVAAIELLCGAQGVDLRMQAGETPGAGSRTWWEAVRARVTVWTADRTLHPDLEAVGAAVREGVFRVQP